MLGTLWLVLRRRLKDFSAKLLGGSRKLKMLSQNCKSRPIFSANYCSREQGSGERMASISVFFLQRPHPARAQFRPAHTRLMRRLPNSCEARDMEASLMLRSGRKISFPDRAGARVDPVGTAWLRRTVESLKLPHEVDGSAGILRAPAATCTLDANNDYDAFHAWLYCTSRWRPSARTGRKGERLILWAIVERGRALSSLKTEDDGVPHVPAPADSARAVGARCSRAALDRPRPLHS
jgi:hypothetical protein